MNKEEKEKVLNEIIEKNDLEKDYIGDYAGPSHTPILTYKGKEIARLGNYESNRAGHCCMSYYDYIEDNNDEWFWNMIKNIPERCRQIDNNIEEERLAAIKQQEIWEKEKKSWEIIKEKVKNFKGEKYDGTAGLMIKDGILAYARKDRNFIKAEIVEDYKMNSSAFCKTIKKFLSA